MPATKQAYENKNLNICTERLEFLDTVIERFYKENYRHAFIVRAHRYGVPIYECNIGENVLPSGLHQNTISRFFSCTKPIIGALMLKLQEDALIDFVEAVHFYLPEFGGEGTRDICIWHLLTHSSGMEDAHFDNYYKSYIRDILGIKELSEEATEEEEEEYNKKVNIALGLSEDASYMDKSLKLIEGYKPAHKPRELMSYFNLGYNLLGHIIKKVTGKSLEEYATEVLFRPLGMNDSHFFVPKEKLDRVLIRKEGTMSYPWINEQYAFNHDHGAGGLKSTVIDMCKFADMVVAGGTIDGYRFLSPASIKAMSRNFNPDINSDFDAWSLGWNYHGTKKDDAGILRSENCLEHGGWAGHKILADPDTGLTCAIITGEYDPPGRNLFGHINNVLCSALD